MAEPTDLIVVEPEGSVRVAGRGAARRLAAQAGRYRLVTDMPGMLVMRAEPEEGQRAPTQVLMSGEIVTRMTLMEIMSFIAQANWRGDLHVVSEVEHRTLSLDQGALKYAQSNASEDRLGEVLFRAGVLSPAQLAELLDDVTPDRRFGELCVERGIIDQPTLFKHLRTQAEQIFYSALITDDGHYVFALANEDDDPPPHMIHVPIQHLLMEGVQRIDEMALFRNAIPSSEMCPVSVPGAPERELDDTAKRVLLLCDGHRNIEEVARAAGLDEFNTTKAIYQLIQQRQVELKSSPKFDGERVIHLVQQFNEVMQDIFIAVATYGGVAQTRSTLDAWIQGSGYAPYFGDGVDDFGCIEPGFVVQALENVEHDAPLEALHQALHELAAFALFSATTTLPRDQELTLARDVNARLKAIRLNG